MEFTKIPGMWSEISHCQVVHTWGKHRSSASAPESARWYSRKKLLRACSHFCKFTKVFTKMGVVGHYKNGGSIKSRFFLIKKIHSSMPQKSGRQRTSIRKVTVARRGMENRTNVWKMLLKHLFSIALLVNFKLQLHSKWCYFSWISLILHVSSGDYNFANTYSVTKNQICRNVYASRTFTLVWRFWWSSSSIIPYCVTSAWQFQNSIS